MPHLLVDISFHGYGHLSQTAPVVNALAQHIPELRVTVRTAAPIAVLQQRFQCPFDHIPVALDFGLTMANAVDVLVEESAARYRDFHADWDSKVQHEAELIRQLAPDLLLANIPYLSLAAAHVAGVSAVGLCSLNWADLYRHYCGQSHYSDDIHAQMLAAYNSALCFLQPQPSMPMPLLHNTRPISPIAKKGQYRREAISAQLAEGAGVEKWVLVAMGGMEFRLPMERWPRVPGVRWLIPAAWNIVREDFTAFESLGLSFCDVLTSVDAILTKPGYGTFAEAACAGIPLLYVSRPDWPEEPYLVGWKQQYGACIKVERTALETGELEPLLQQLWAAPPATLPESSGAEEAARYLSGLLCSGDILSNSA